MTVWVVRHACAGHKEDWDGPDDDRPLDPAGQEQAEALARVLVGEPTSLWSSPTKRCVDTLAPLSAATGVPVQTDAALRGPNGKGLLERIEAPGTEGMVLCTHGEVMRPVLDALRRDPGVTSDHSDDELLLKGAAWRLDRRPDGGWHLDLLAPTPRLDCPHHPDRP